MNNDDKVIEMLAQVSQQLGAVNARLDRIENEQRALSKSVRDGNKAFKDHLDVEEEARRVQEERVEMIESAFLTNEHGALDVHGHKYDHKTRMTNQRWWRNKLDSAFGKVFDAALLAAIIYIGLALIDRIRSGGGHG